LKKFFKGVFTVIIACISIALAFIVFANIFVIASTAGNIITEDEAIALGADGGNSGRPISVLGASVQNGEPSTILANRLDVGMRLFNDKAGDALWLTGDSGRADYYDEVAVMSSYVTNNGSAFGISETDLDLDHEGYSTYASMYNLANYNKDNLLSSYHLDSAIVVTQKYHLYRALYIAEKNDLKVYGVVATGVTTHQFKREIREIFARTKDFICVLLKLPPDQVPDIDEYYHK
jgi:vancomycin permeability regulator SanA